MRPAYIDDKKIEAFIFSALKEDVGDGDHSSLASIPPNAVNQARLIIKGEGVIAGVDLAAEIFAKVDDRLEMDLLLKDGQEVNYGDIGLTVKGSAQSILTAERLVLNCMQRMSGIATFTRELTNKIAHTKAKLLDTRKTTPNFRMMEKWAVYLGGGHNHRFGLFDMIILKDNHIDYAGGIENAIKSAQQYLKEKNKALKIEVETRNLDEVNQVLKVGGIDRIMLDNMRPDQLREAVRLIDGKYEVEASGGITEDTIVQIAETGVDYISVGALTHSIKSMDISLKAF